MKRENGKFNAQMQWLGREGQKSELLRQKVRKPQKKNIVEAKRNPQSRPERQTQAGQTPGNIINKMKDKQVAKFDSFYRLPGNFAPYFQCSHTTLWESKPKISEG